MDSFKALRIYENSDGSFSKQIESLTFDQLPDHEVLVKVHYAGLNYKDALSGSGHKGITRQFPHTPGIDAVGEVVEHSGSEFMPGQQVLVTSYDFGMNTHGGFSAYIRVPAGWVVPMPEGLSPEHAMIMGTAGLTAGIALHNMERAGQRPEMGPVLVTGASGGVGSLAIAILHKAGYTPWACTGSPQTSRYLESIGAAAIKDRRELEAATKKPLFKGGWAGAIDTVGGEILVNAVKGCGMYGGVAVCGLVGSPRIDMSVYPFILKGVAMLGVDSAEFPMPERRKVWEKLSQVWKPDEQVLDAMAQYCTLEDIPDQMDAMLAGKTQGRVIATF